MNVNLQRQLSRHPGPEHKRSMEVAAHFIICILIDYGLVKVDGCAQVRKLREKIACEQIADNAKLSDLPMLA